VSTTEPVRAPPRERLARTAAGTHAGAFAPLDWGLMLTAAGIWGASFAFMEIALRDWSPGLITLLRVAFGAAALAVLPAARVPVDRADWPRLAVLGFTWMALPLTLFPIAQQWISSSLAGMLNSAMPVTTALVAAAWSRRAPGPAQVAGIAIGLLGVLAIGWDGLTGSGTTALGVALVVIAVVSYSVSVNLAAPVQQRYGTVAVLVRIQLVAVVLTLPGGLAAVPSSSWSWSALAALLALGVLGTGLAFVAMGTLIGRVGPTRASVVTYLIPVVAIGLGVALFDERVPPGALVGTGLVLTGAWLASRREA